MPHHSGAELPGAQALRQMAAQSDSRGLFSDRAPDPAYEIGRASCRERVCKQV